MSNHSFLPFSSTVTLIQELRSSIRDHVAREKELGDSHALKKYHLNKAHAELLENHDLENQARHEQAAKGFEATLEVATTINADRASRIERAREAVELQLQDALNQQEGGGTFRLQKVNLMSERERDAASSQTEATFREREAWLVKATDTISRVIAQSRKRLIGYPSCARLIKKADPKATEINEADSPTKLFKEFQEQLVSTVSEVKAFKKQFPPRLFSPMPLPGWGILLAAAHFAAVSLGLTDSHEQILPYSAGAFCILFAIWAAGLRPARKSAKAIAPGVARLLRYLEICPPLAQKNAEETREKIKKTYQSSIEDSEKSYHEALSKAEEMRASRPQKIAEKYARILKKYQAQAVARTATITHQRDTGLAAITAEIESSRRQHIEDHEAKIAAEQALTDTAMAELQASWDADIKPKLQTLAASTKASFALFPAWDDHAAWDAWSPATCAGKGVRFGQVNIDIEQLADGLPESRGLKMPEIEDGKRFSAPLHLTFPEEGSFLIEAGSRNHEVPITSLNNLVLRLLAALPPGKVDFTIIDPIGLGENFSSLMHLADYEEGIINNRIWTQTQQIDQRLSELTEHMEKVIQMYLRKDFETIVEYNEQAGNIAEKYHFLICADFPNAFSDQAASRLLSIASAGGKCGVFTLIHHDPRPNLPNGFNLEELQAASVCITTTSNGELALPELMGEGVSLNLDHPPEDEGVNAFIHRVGTASIDSSRVEVPFDQVSPPDNEIWTRQTSKELVVPIGRTGATKLQELAIGKGTRQHALIAGKTGSGKSTLFHVMITNLALWCSPDEVEFYLVDFKKGVEFKAYATRKLPHARVIAIESDREFGLSVLQRVDDELRRRGEAFRKLGVQNIANYLQAGGEGPVPRTLLLIDEFQELFTEEDKISQDASVLLDRIVRQGRAFGIHVILGSQTLGGAFTLARTTLGQMAIRVALMCDESDAYLIMDENNPAPRLLTRPGEGIYNDMSGKMEGNSPFQVVWLPDEVRDAQIDRVIAHAKAVNKPLREPVVFEGNVPAEVTENPDLRAALAAPPGGADSHAPTPIWLGAPNSIKGPSHALLRRAGGNHLMIVGPRDDAALSILSIALVSLCSQFRSADTARIIYLDATSPDSSENLLLKQAIEALPRPIEHIRSPDIAPLLSDLESEFQLRSSEGADGKPPVFFLINNLQKFKQLRYEDDFSFSMDDDKTTGAKPGNQLDSIFCEGAGLGIHILFNCDTYGNLGRFLSRKAQQECELRVLFQMSANDSAALTDSPKASTLGLNRGLFYNGQEGHLEIFHPYSLPAASWFEGAAKQLS